jgi:hypothetical protein
MKSKKRSGKGTQAGKRGIKDLPVSDAKAKNAKGGSAVSDVMKNFGSALQTAARGG